MCVCYTNDGHSGDNDSLGREGNGLNYTFRDFTFNPITNNRPIASAVVATQQYNIIRVTTTFANEDYVVHITEHFISFRSFN